MAKSKLTLNDFFIQGAKNTSLLRAFQRNPERFLEMYDVDDELLSKVTEKMDLINRISTDLPEALPSIRNEFLSPSSTAAYADSFGDQFKDRGFTDRFKDSDTHKDVFKDRHNDTGDA